MAILIDISAIDINANSFFLLSIYAKTIVLVYFLVKYGFEPTPPPTPEEEESEEEQDEDEDGFAGGGHQFIIFDIDKDAGGGDHYRQS